MKEVKALSNFKRRMLILAGHIFVGLAVIGAILPLMPTTIFLILAAACYAKSSPKFYDWLLENKYFGKHLKNYKEKKGINAATKTVSLSVLWLTIAATIYFTEPKLFITIILLVIAAAVTVHLLTIKTYKEIDERLPSKT